MTCLAEAVGGLSPSFDKGRSAQSTSNHTIYLLQMLCIIGSLSTPNFLAQVQFLGRVTLTLSLLTVLVVSMVLSTLSGSYPSTRRFRTKQVIKLHKMFPRLYSQEVLRSRRLALRTSVGRPRMDDAKVLCASLLIDSFDNDELMSIELVYRFVDRTASGVGVCAGLGWHSWSCNLRADKPFNQFQE